MGRLLWHSKFLQGGASREKEVVDLGKRIMACKASEWRRLAKIRGVL
jgi:hypothetical protein